MLLPSGQIINSRYRVINLLGQGGFGAVYYVWDINLERYLALKENLDNSPDTQRQFKREAQILFDLVHPNLPKVIDYFVIQGQGQYIVMEYVDGQDLQEMLDVSAGPLPEKQVLQWIEQVCDALSYLHSRNPQIIHRDIKPANIKITSNDKAMLVDFGIAKTYIPNLKTTVGAKAVTPGYSPPEQYGKGTTDARSDIYALGATMYTLLTGHEPPESIDILSGNSPPPLPITFFNSSVSPCVKNAIEHAMQLEYGSRPGSVAEFMASLLDKEITNNGQQVYDVILGKLATKQRNRRITLTSWEWVLSVIAFFFLITIILVLFSGLGGIGVNEREPTNTLWGSITSTRSPGLIQTLELYATASLSIVDLPTPSRIVTNTFIAPSLPARIEDNQNVPMALVTAGEFQMGSAKSDQHAESDEGPYRNVYLDTYYIDLYETTNAMFARFVEATGYRTDAEKENSGWIINLLSMEWEETEGVDWQHPNGPFSTVEVQQNHPVVQISWNDAIAFCRWRGARLPTEAEWEKAARGGLEGALYPWGNEAPDCSRANFKGCSGDTESVGSFSPNQYGLYDMAGNVWEWAFDWYQINYNISSISNPTGPENGSGHVLRGGSWSDIELDLRVANRGANYPDSRLAVYGFRCVRSP